ncbi:MAG: 5-(carboxyamino)imidazole ribonucleotide mutase [Chloroflexota bacterium]
MAPKIEHDRSLFNAGAIPGAGADVPGPEQGPGVLVLLGSDSDLPKVRDCALTLEELGVAYEVTIASAHRTPARTAALAEGAADRGVGVIICAAGAAAHLAGAVAAQMPLPVIGLPLSGSALSGVDALYATVQMPPGVPVATVGIDAARNAAILAAQIIATADASLRARIRALRLKMKTTVEEKAAKLAASGWPHDDAK